MANICTPTRVDHLDNNSGINVHTVAKFVDDPDNDRVWILYASLASGVSTFRSGVYLREYNYVTKTLGDVLPVATDNSGTGRTSPLTRADNRGPMGLFKLSTGRFICVYSVSRDGTNGACVKESTDNGATWTDEVELLVPWSTSPVSWQYLDGHTDGTDVFIIGRATAGGGGPAGYGTGDILLLRRTGIGTWMWSRIVNNENDTTVSNSNYGQNPATIFWFESVGTDVWRMAFVGGYGLRNLSYQGMFCWENQAHTTTSEWVGSGGDDSTNWNRRTIHDFTGDAITENRRPVLRMGTDNILRLVYFDTFGVPSKTYAYGATSVNWGQDWSDIGVLDLATVNSSTWDATYDASFSLDSQNRWILSTCHDSADFLTLNTSGFTTYLTDRDDGTFWSKYFKCDIQFDANENLYQDGPGVSFWTTNRHIRLLQSSAASGSYYRLVLLDGSVPVIPTLVCPPGTADYHVLYGSEVTICAEDVTAGHSYSWSGPNGYTATTRCITFVVTEATVGTYIVRITDDASGAYVDCPHVVTGYSNPPEPPVVPPPVIIPEYPLENRIFRRGVIKVQRSEIPQRGASSVAEVERLD